MKYDMDATASDDITQRVGDVLQDRYRLLALIAKGGMGSVYRGERVGLGRPVAIKFMSAAFARDPQLVKRFEVEAHAMSKLSHPNCISVIDYGVDRLPYLVMDLVEGVSLRTLLERGPLPARRAIAIARQVLAALSHAHTQRIIHRDIKPENIVVGQKPGIEDHALILDFGLAKLLGSQANLTQGMALGTPNYMAPEQMGVGTVDERTDIYAVGIVLFEVLTGKKPFDHDQLGEVFRRQLNMPPPPLRQARPDQGFSPTLESVLLRAMAKAQTGRFASAADFATALEATPEAGGSAADVTLLSVPGVEPVTLPAAVPAVVAQPKAHAGRPMRQRMRRVLAKLRPAARRRPIQFGAVAAGMIALVLLITFGRGERPEREASTPRPVASSPPAVPSPAVMPKRTPELQALLRTGDRERALRRVSELRRERPDHAELAAVEAELYFGKRWWSEGLIAYREARRLDPSFGRDPVLLAEVIRSLQSPRFHRSAGAFLRELGDPARVLLEEAARSHDSPAVRARAASLVETWPAGEAGRKS
jgi:eukaryotic-like serine/threonine-protein kinase